MELHHIAIWTFQLEKLKEFYTRYFHGTSNNKYVNPTKGFESYFISFQSGPSLELMSRKDIQDIPFDDSRLGLTHIAFTFPSKEEVLRFTEEMRAAGYTIAGEPRTSGDGYFESVILDPDDNRIECVFDEKKAKEETNISKPVEQEYDTLLEIWEKAVRDSHHFLTEEDIQFYKPLVRDHYLKAVDLFIVRNEYGKIAGFMGLSDDLIEMLFIRPDEKGKGYGKQLVNHAINKKHIYKVDVNEGNEQALNFYKHIGYKVIGRDDTDSMGKPFPILHLQIDKK